MTGPLTILDETYRVAWGDLVYIRDNIGEVLVTCLVGPLLYLLAFGFGLGGSMEQGSSQYIAFIIPGIIALTTLSATFSTVSMKILLQRLFYMSFDELKLCPIHISSMVLGKTLAGTVRALISCTAHIKPPNTRASTVESSTSFTRRETPSARLNTAFSANMAATA